MKIYLRLAYIAILCFITLFCTGCFFQDLANKRAEQQLSSNINESVKEIPGISNINVKIEKDGESNKAIVTFCVEPQRLYIDTTSNVKKTSMIIFKNCFTSKIPISEVEIEAYKTKMDAYGNDEKSYLATFKMSEKTGHRVNWDVYDKLNFDDVVNTKKWDQEYLDAEKNESQWRVAYFLNKHKQYKVNNE